MQTFRSAKAIAEDGEVFEKFNSWEEVPEALRNVTRQGKGALHESMFASSYDDTIKNELPKCLRVMPHH